jgi:hypothetical protein
VPVAQFPRILLTAPSEEPAPRWCIACVRSHATDAAALLAQVHLLPRVSVLRECPRNVEVSKRGEFADDG